MKKIWLRTLSYTDKAVRTLLWEHGHMKPRRYQEKGGLSRWVGLPFASALNSCFSDTVFVTLLSTAVETAISEARKLIRTGGVPTSLTVLF